MTKQSTHKLTAKQNQFCCEYMIDLNATKAAERAGYSKRTAYSIGQENLKKPEIQNRITQLQAKAREKTDLSRERIEYELKCILDAKITDYMSFDGETITWKSFDELSDQQIRAISSMSEDKYGKIEMKLHGRTWSIDRVIKLFGYDPATDFNIQLQSMNDEVLNNIITKLLAKQTK
jgi:phage terminase small subunit